jgi:hypothetical protein
MTTAIFPETLENRQHSTRIIPKSEVRVHTNHMSHKLDFSDEQFHVLCMTRLTEDIASEKLQF